jgi:hypothetical protein
MSPRGISNCNPGNLRWGDPWQGLVPEARRTDKDFCQFVAPAWGIRAIAVTLVTYQDKHGLDTVAGIIARWAPPNENVTSAYVTAVAHALGVSADDVINVHDYAVMAPLVRAIIRHENGPAPTASGAWYDAVTLDEGLRMAGIVAPAPRARPTPVGIAALAGGTAAAVEAMNQVQPVLQATAQVVSATAGWPQWLRLLGTLLVLVSLGAAAWAWWRQRRAQQAVHAP